LVIFQTSHARFEILASDADLYIIFTASYAEDLETYLQEMHIMLVATGPYALGAFPFGAPLFPSYITKNY
jgi:hypothetical protein